MAASQIDAPPPPKQSIWAAGCVLFRHGDEGEPEYLLIHRDRYDDWTLPKGKLDRGESFIDAAVRETLEETGFKPKNPRLVGTVAYDTTAGNPKIVRWYLARAGKGSFAPNSEVDRVKWKRLPNALEKLTYRNDREVLERAHDMVLERSAGTIYLVRHGWAGERRVGDADDWRRPLDDRGKRQRKALRQMLQAHPITRIASSDYARCFDTVKPLSKRLGIPIEPETALLEGSHPHRLVSFIHELQGETAVLCTHGDVIEDLIGHLFAAGIPLEGDRVWEKGSVWQLRTVKGRVTKGVYIPPAA